MKDLSILIPTLPARIDKLSMLIQRLNKQVIDFGLIDRVQILTLCDTKEYSVGVKRNKLLELSTGRYVCFIDDDDQISDTYLFEIIRAIQSNADVITFCGEYVENNLPQYFSISRVHKNDFTDGNNLYRLPNHLCPVKREIALQSLFTDKNYGEDSDYANRINTLIQSEYHIQEKLYYYIYNDALSQTKPNNNRNAFY
jgi:glycosyltransferase involved in cell wall biosynthesis